MFEIVYRDSRVRAPSDIRQETVKRPYSDTEAVRDGLRYRLNTSVEVSGDKYVMRACTLIHHGVVVSFPKDVTFPHVGDHFTGWILAKGSVGTLVVWDDEILNYGSKLPDARQEYYSTYGDPVHQLFTTVGGNGGFVLAVSRFLVHDEVPHGEMGIPPTTPSVEAVQEKNSTLLQKLRAGADAQAAARAPDVAMAEAVASKRWDDLSEDERSFVMRKTAERMGIISR